MYAGLTAPLTWTRFVASNRPSARLVRAGPCVAARSDPALCVHGMHTKRRARLIGLIWFRYLLPAPRRPGAGMCRPGVRPQTAGAPAAAIAAPHR